MSSISSREIPLRCVRANIEFAKQWLVTWQTSNDRRAGGFGGRVGVASSCSGMTVRDRESEGSDESCHLSRLGGAKVLDGCGKCSAM